MGLKTKILEQLETGSASLRQLKKRFGNDKKLVGALESLCAAQKIALRGGAYHLVRLPPEESIPCSLVKLGRSFGFAQPLDGSEDIFIAGRFLHGAMPGDLVYVMVRGCQAKTGSREGEVVQVQRRRTRFVGTVCQVGERLALAPDDSPDTLLLIKRRDTSGVQPGEKVAAKLVEHGRTHRDLRVRVELRFGDGSCAANCAQAILYGLGIEQQFPAAVQQEAERYAGARVDGRQIRKREDLREMPIFTIDGPDTKDIDDAISLERIIGGYRLGVHIADVSYYVRPGSALDEDAFARGTSVYYANSVVPMLPKELSNEICSLNPNEERLAFSCFMKLDAAGRVTDARLVKSVLRSRVQGVYGEVNALLAGTAEEGIARKYEQVLHVLPLLQEVYEKRAALRKKNGYMEIESNEAKFVLDDNGRCMEVLRRSRGRAERIIEEFMLMANESVAAIAREAQLPFVYRVHEQPPAGRIEALKEMLDACGISYSFKGEAPTARELSALLDKTRGTSWQRVVHVAVLRSMAKAEYQSMPRGHFGLGLMDYAHFTSPIRRYPDLAIHRILTDWLAGAGTGKLNKRYKEFVSKASVQSSERELAAMTAERDISDCYKAEAMSGRLGQEFDGVISSVASFGIYVELENTVEGLVRVDSLAPAGHSLTLTQGVALSDPLTGKRYRIGDTIRVRLSGVDISAGHVDFVPLD